MSLELVSPGPDPEKRPASAVRHGNPGGPAHGMTAQSVGRTEDADALAAEEPPAEGRSGTGQGAAGPDTDEAPEGTESTGTAPERTAGGNELLEKSAELPALSKDDTEAAYGPELRDAARGHVGPRPGIVTRKGWGADESLREKQFGYTKTVKTAFVHHTATSNNYSCKQAPSIIRSIYRYHVKSSKWRDIGYNFLVDKCGTIYEGRAGGVANPVMGAHTYGFNSNSTGIAVIGSHASAPPTREAVEGVAKLTAWKLGLHGANAKGKTTVVSGGGTKYPKGRKVTLNTISGHRDGFSTDCPGAKLYGKLGDVRAIAGRLQGR
ncbi:peptidoglycan recognition protein [Streptomyces sp. HNM0574]|nr:peptidoglycan recognition protein [Streptomyces sp. HNM0574]